MLRISILRAKDLCTISFSVDDVGFPEVSMNVNILYVDFYGFYDEKRIVYYKLQIILQLFSYVSHCERFG